MLVRSPNGCRLVVSQFTYPSELRCCLSTGICQPRLSNYSAGFRADLLRAPCDDHQHAFRHRTLQHLRFFRSRFDGQLQSKLGSLPLASFTSLASFSINFCHESAAPICCCFARGRIALAAAATPISASTKLLPARRPQISQASLAASVGTVSRPVHAR